MKKTPDFSPAVAEKTNQTKNNNAQKETETQKTDKENRESNLIEKEDKSLQTKIKESETTEEAIDEKDKAIEKELDKISRLKEEKTRLIEEGRDSASIINKDRELKEAKKNLLMMETERLKRQLKNNNILKDKRKEIKIELLKKEIELIVLRIEEEKQKRNINKVMALTNEKTYKESELEKEKQEETAKQKKKDKTAKIEPENLLEEKYKEVLNYLKEKLKNINKTGMPVDIKELRIDAEEYVKRIESKDKTININAERGEYLMREKYGKTEVESDKTIGRKGEVMVYYLLLKMLGEHYHVFMCSEYDDTHNKADICLIDKEANSYLALNVKVNPKNKTLKNYNKSKRSKKNPIEEKARKIAEMNRKGGTDLSFGFNFKNGRIELGRINNIPITYFILEEKDLNQLILETDLNSSKANEIEKKVFLKLIKSIQEQIKKISEIRMEDVRRARGDKENVKELSVNLVSMLEVFTRIIPQIELEKKELSVVGKYFRDAEKKAKEFENSFFYNKTTHSCSSKNKKWKCRRNRRRRK